MALFGKNFSSSQRMKDKEIIRLILKVHHTPSTLHHSLVFFLCLQQLNSRNSKLSMNYYIYIQECYEYSFELYGELQVVYNDIKRTFTNHPLCRLKPEVYQKSMDRIIRSSVCASYLKIGDKNECIGYTQGFSYLVGYFLLWTGDEVESFYLLKKLVMDLNLNLIWLPGFLFHKFIFRVMNSYLTEQNNMFTLKSSNIYKSKYMLDLLFSSSNYEENGVILVFLSKLLNSVLCYVLTWDILSVFMKYLVCKGLWNGLFRSLLVILELFYDFIFVNKDWMGDENLCSFDREEFQEIYDIWEAEGHKCLLEFSEGSVGIMMMFQMLLNSCGSSYDSVFSYTSIFKSHAHLISKFKSFKIQKNILAKNIDKIFHEDESNELQLVYDNLKIKPNGYHFKGSDLLDGPVGIHMNYKYRVEKRKESEIQNVEYINGNASTDTKHDINPTNTTNKNNKVYSRTALKNNYNTIDIDSNKIIFEDFSANLKIKQFDTKSNNRDNGRETQLKENNRTNLTETELNTMNGQYNSKTSTNLHIDSMEIEKVNPKNKIKK